MPTASQHLTLDDLAQWCGTSAHALAHCDFTAAWPVVTQILVSYTQQCFDAGRAPDGNLWAPLKRPRKDGSSTPLRDKDILMASVTGGAGSQVSQSPQLLIWGSGVWYAGFHQYGTRTIPARPFVGVSQEAAADIGQVLAQYVVGFLR
jgi:phage virion morphogenesis protein